MDVQSLRNFGVAASDAASSWPDDVKQRMSSGARQMVLDNLDMGERLQFGFKLLQEKTLAMSLDRSCLRARGMKNEAFLEQQTEFLTVFSALAKVKGPDEALSLMLRVMEETAREPLHLTLPDPEDVRRFPDAFEVFREYFRQSPRSSAAAGCHAIEICEDSENAFQFDITWCVWLELAKLHGVPEACKCNCYADDLIYPEYFQELGIKYQRTSTLAHGAPRCDFRFERLL